jgi:hypothetical protein
MGMDPKARKFTLSWDGGYLTATVGLLESIYGQDFMDKVGAGKAKTITVKSHSRTRVIGGPATTVAAHQYGLIEYPRFINGGAAGGQPIEIEKAGSWWTVRLGGSVQDFKAWLSGAGKPLSPFQFRTAKGAVYSSAA